MVMEGVDQAKSILYILKKAEFFLLITYKSMLNRFRKRPQDHANDITNEGLEEKHMPKEKKSK